MRPRITLALGALAALAALAAPAHANEIPCSPVETGTIQLDGLLGDWKGVDGVGVDSAAQILKGKDSWSGPSDLSFDVYCNHDDLGLYLAVNVKDEYFIRTRAAGAGDDHVAVLFGAKQLVIYPGDLREVKAKMTWGKSGKVKGAKMAEAMQTGGYSIELFLPWKQVPGYKQGAPSFPGAVWVYDSDSKARGKVQTVMGTAASGQRGSFTFAQAKVDLSAFLKDKGFSAKDVRTKINADVVGDGRLEQVVLARGTIGVVGEDLPGGSYFYLDLPVKQGKDVYWLKVMDINGDGKGELVTRYAERAGNGRRELIAVYRFNDSNQFVRWFAHEILKGQGERMITNRFTMKPRKGSKGKVAKGKKGKKGKGKTVRTSGGSGVDFIFDKPAARGFTEQTFREEASQDCHSILLPWGETKKRQFRFEGEEYQEL